MKGHIFYDLMKDIEIPRFVRVTYEMTQGSLDDPYSEVIRQFKDGGLTAKIRPGDRVCITVGSREISKIYEITKAIVDSVKGAGGIPFIIPAMGSHGGATAEGQRQIVEGWGITEERIGAPIESSMETVKVGTTDSGLDVHIDKCAANADWIIVAGRIKPHTDFRGEVESGLMKMITIGMGKQRGASICHTRGFPLMSRNVRDMANVAIARLPFLCGVGILENAAHRTYKIEVVPAEKIDEREPELLLEAKALMPRIPFKKAHTLIVDEIGKNISGPGMDPNIVGRSGIIGRWEPNFDAIMIRDITDESHHNGNGLGVADVTTRRAFDKFSFEMTYPNSITCIDPVGIKIPMVMPNDKLALKYALRVCDPSLENGEKPKVVWIHNTLSMGSFLISESLIDDARKADELTIVSSAMEIQYDGEDNFAGLKEI